MLQHVYIILIVFFLIGCTKDNVANKNIDANISFTEITHKSTKVTVLFKQLTFATIAEMGICWNVEPNPSVECYKQVFKKIDSINIIKVEHLVAGTLYYYSAYIKYKDGNIVYSNAQTVTTYNNKKINIIDNTLIGKMEHYKIPGLSIAIIKDEALVYVSCYGWADKMKNIKVSNGHAYRVASLSKAFTVSGLTLFVNNGNVNFQQTVFGSVGLLGTSLGNIPSSQSNKNNITIQHLIDHKSGWVNTVTDPFFINNSVTRDNILRNYVEQIPLSNNPGKSFFYLNAGYSIIGKIIERLAGNNYSYEKYMKEFVFDRCGYNEFEIANNTLPNKRFNEVVYYQTEFSPYNINVKRMDASAGWLARTTDIAKWITRFNNENIVPDLANRLALRQTFLSSNTWKQYGSLPGTSAIVSKVNNNFSFVLLMNTREERQGSMLLDDLNDTVISFIQNNSIEWGNYNLF